MKLSVIVPSYGRPESLRRCLAAILAGTRLPDELIAVVRESDPESQAAVDEVAAREGGSVARKVMVREPGQIAAMNRGLEESSGDVICFTDDDTVPTPQWLERLEAGYAEPGVVGVGGRDRIPDIPDEGPAERVGLVTWYGVVIGNHHRGCDGIRRVDHLKGANMSFLRTALSPFDPILYRAAAVLNDTDACLAARRHGVLLYDPGAIVDHYPAVRRDGVGRDVDDPEVVRADSHNLVYCLLKHLPWWARPVFVAYAFVVGQGACFGLLKWVQALVRRRPNATGQLWASTRGKAMGVRTYLRSRGGKAAPAAGPEATDVP